MEQYRHVLITTYPVQGHINPALQLSRKLLRLGIQVTFATSLLAFNRMSKASGGATAPKGLDFAPFSDDNGFNVSSIETEGSNTLRNVIHSSAQKGCPVTCLVYTVSLSWAAAVARSCAIPAAVLLTQPATVMDIYYYFFHGYEDEVKKVDMSDPDWSIQFPGLPLLKTTDLPSFLLPASDPKYSFVLPTLKMQIQTLDDEEKPNILINSFGALEPESHKAIQNYNMIPIGPLIPSTFLDNGNDPADTFFSADLFRKSSDYKEWLDSKTPGSVIYVSFGSFMTLPRKQMEEIASGLLKTGKAFLWVIREKEDGEEETEEDKLSCMEELKQKGMIVPWCSQLEVLAHPSVGCFVTHCGWNSTLESIASGVPVVAFPLWNDQGTNAKLIEDVWRTGVRVTPNEDGTVQRDEIVRCVEMVIDNGEEGSVLKNNVKKWKELACEAMQDGGSSDKNLNSFLDSVKFN